jgi:hypothetical protein
MQPTTTSRATPDTPVVLAASDVEGLPWRDVPGCPGVEEKELWRSGDLVHALIRYGPGASTPGYPHSGAHHYIWVVAGTAQIGDRRVDAGSYAHIPAGFAHPIRAMEPAGCTLLQMHRSLTGAT